MKLDFVNVVGYMPAWIVHGALGSFLLSNLIYITTTIVFISLTFIQYR